MFKDGFRELRKPSLPNSGPKSFQIHFKKPSVWLHSNLEEPPFFCSRIAVFHLRKKKFSVQFCLTSPLISLFCSFYVLIHHLYLAAVSRTLAAGRSAPACPASATRRTCLQPFTPEETKRTASMHQQLLPLSRNPAPERSNPFYLQETLKIIQ